VLGRSELQVKQGYLGLSIQYANARRPFPTSSEPTTSSTSRFVHPDSHPDKKPVLGLLVDGVPPGLQLSELQKQLGNSYDVRSFTLADSAQPAADVSLSPCSDPLTRSPRPRPTGFSVSSTAVGARWCWRAACGSPQMPVANPPAGGLERFLKPFGITIRTDMAYDLMANEIVPLPTDIGQVLQAYPFLSAPGARPSRRSTRKSRR